MDRIILRSSVEVEDKKPSVNEIKAHDLSD